MTAPPAARRGATTGDVLIVLSAVALIAALAYPRVRAIRFEERVAAVRADLETIRAGALQYVSEHGAWPPEAQPGEVPPGLGSFLPGGFTFRRADHVFDWNRWEAVEVREIRPAPEGAARPEGDQPEPDTLAPPPYAFSSFASVTVHAGDKRLLAALLGGYGDVASFVRDTTWTLVLPRRVEEP